jgi:hypothetical protein
MRCTRLCRPGHSIVSVTLFSTSFRMPLPQTSTSATRYRYGDHALTVRPKPCVPICSTACVSPAMHEAVRRLPHFQQHDHADDRGQRRDDIDELRADVVRHQELHRREADAADDDGGDHAAQRIPAAHDEHQVRRDEYRDRGAEAADPRAQLEHRQARDARERRDGTPIEPNATGAVFARRQIAAAIERREAEARSIAAATATGVPKPAAPSMNAPSANAISSACRRRSPVRPPIESLMTSNLPVSR